MVHRWLSVYAGVWLLSLAVATGHGAFENDWLRCRPLFAALIGLGLFHSLAIVQYDQAIDWSKLSALIWGGLIASFIGLRPIR